MLNNSCFNVCMNLTAGGILIFIGIDVNTDVIYRGFIAFIFLASNLKQLFNSRHIIGPEPPVPNSFVMVNIEVFNWNVDVMN